MSYWGHANYVASNEEQHLGIVLADLRDRVASTNSVGNPSAARRA